MNEDSLKQLQIIEQNLQTYAVQKQGIASQLAEAESALEGLKNTSVAYRIIGEIMVSGDKEAMKNEMSETVNSLKKRLSLVEAQENRLREEAEKLQKELMSSIKEEKNDSA